MTDSLTVTFASCVSLNASCSFRIRERQLTPIGMISDAPTLKQPSEETTTLMPYSVNS